MMLANLINVLLIEDNLAEARLIKEILKGANRHQFHLTHTQRLGEALALIEHNAFDVVLLDLTLPDSSGLDSLTPLLRVAPQLPIVVLTNMNDEETALEAVRRGAQDYLVKRFAQLEMLVRSICYAIERKQVAEELREVNEALEERVKRRTEELMKAKELNQLKSEFVSMLSHDFRNPLNTILLSAGLLEDSSEFLTKEQQIAYFQMIRTAIKDMDQILNEVLLIGKADAGKLQCYFTDLDLEELCRRVVQSLQLSSPKHQLILRIEGNLQGGLWDENLLRHILNNLLGNALKYSPQGGQVIFDVIRQRENVIFRVQDQGIGIPPEQQKSLFQPFYRADNVDSIPGTGLGLAIVQRCIETHGGKIRVDSVIGEGTTFTVTLPIKWEEMVSDATHVTSCSV